MLAGRCLVQSFPELGVLWIAIEAIIWLTTHPIARPAKVTGA